jgi:Family of unknown function (DUF5684)
MLFILQSSDVPPEVPAAVSGALIFGMLLVGLAFYIFFSYCFKRICEKAGADPGILIWIPILQLIPVFKAAGMNPLLILAMFVPLVNIVIIVMMVANLAKALGKNPWIAALLFIPILGIIPIPYLAFSGDAGRAPATV